MIKLMNSAMMPQPGTYRLRRITHTEFCRALQEATEKNMLESYIGYQQNIDLIYQWTGVHVPLSRAETSLEDGDSLLIMKLRYRLNDPSRKGAPVDKTSFEFFEADYSSC